MKRLFALLGLAVMLAGAVFYFLRARNGPGLSAPTNGPGNGAQSAVPVTVTTVRRRAMRQAVTLIGILRADRQAVISTKVPSRILAILVRAGEKVRAGQPLARLDVGDYRALLEGAGAGVTAAEAQSHKAVDGRRAREIEMDGQIAQAEGGLKVALAKRQQAELGVLLNDSTAKSDAERAEAAVRQAEAGLKQAEIGLAQADEVLARLKFLQARGGVARADLEGAQAQADIARAARDAAKAGLEQARAAARPASETLPLRAKVSAADVEAARAGVKLAEDGLRTARRAKAEALRIADRDIEAAQALVTQAKAGRAQASAQVGGSVLVSPFEGIVTDLTARAGEFAQPGMGLMNVIAPGTVYLEVAAPARYAPFIQPRRPARVRLDTLPNRPPLDAEVTEILPIATSDNRSVPVRLRFVANGAPFFPGAMARAEIELARDPGALTIPLDALRNEGSTTFVYAVINGKAQRRNVTLGASEGPNVQALSGLASGMTIILTGPASLQSGTPVQIVGR